MPLARPWSWLLAGLLVTSVGCTAGPATAVSPSTPSPADPQPTVVTAAPAPASAPRRSVSRAQTYGFYAPYDQTGSSVVRAPRGFEPLYLQNVGRHGSRATVSGKSVKKVRALCEDAATSGELTSLGADFCREVDTLGFALNRVGYGDLSPLGKQEWEEIGRRTAEDYRPFFAAAAAAEAPIGFSSSKRTRSKDSSQAFRAGIEAGTPDLVLELKKRVNEDDLLRFSTPLTDEARSEIDRIEHSSATRGAATHVLRRLFGGETDSLGDARAVWALYAIAPGMGLDLDDYLKRSDAEQLAALDDADTFYRYGPGVRGNEAFGSAVELRDDLLRAIQDRLAGGKSMGMFRHGHAETIAPLAALLRLGPSSRPVPAETSPWEHGWLGSENAKMAANIDLAAYRKRGTVLVTIRYNEEPVQVLDCPSSTYGRYFYDFDTLRRCWS